MALETQTSASPAPLHAWHALPAEAVQERWQTDARHGLSHEEAARRLAEHGANELEEQRGRSPWLTLSEQFLNFIVLVLIGAAVLAGVVAHWLESIAILAIVVLNGMLGFVQERRAERTLAALRDLAPQQASVLRADGWRVVPARELVPGDVVMLEMGDRVPADVRLSETHSAAVEEASLTGESLPVSKEADAIVRADAAAADQRNMAFAGTTLVAGRARGVVVATGMQTQIGQIARLVGGTLAERTPLQERLSGVGRSLVYLTLALTGVVLVAYLLRGYPLAETFLIAVTLAVAAIPEGLPAVVTVVLALGVSRMAARNALVRRLASVETLGAADVICTDKTGTLTENRMVVRGLCCDGAWSDFEPRAELPANYRLALVIGALCNSTELQGGRDAGEWPIIGDPTEGALRVAAAQAGLWYRDLPAAGQEVEEIPFDSTRQRMAVIYEVEADAILPCGRIALVKGSPEAVLERCDRHRRGEDVLPLDEDARAEIRAHNRTAAADGLRVLALAYRELPPDFAGPYDEGVIERGMIYVGLVSMRDPPRPEVFDALRKAREAGIHVVMITGDQPRTALAIARELELIDDEDARALSGSELAAMSDEELGEVTRKVRIFARVAPRDKLRLVRAFRSRGSVVAMTGDGVNDAPALKEADIGVSMGRVGTDVAREASDMVLMDDNFATIVAAVEEGRAIYNNIRRFIAFLLSCNSGEIFAMLIASLIGTPPPLVAIQILWINLATDSLPAMALGVEPAAPDLMRRPPRPRDREMLDAAAWTQIALQGALIGGSALAAFLLAHTVWDASLATARTMAFATLVFAQLSQAMHMRNPSLSIFRLGVASNRWLLAAIGVVTATTVAVVHFPPLQAVLSTTHLRGGEWLAVAGLSALPLLASELVKAAVLPRLPHRIRTRLSGE